MRRILLTTMTLLLAALMAGGINLTAIAAAPAPQPAATPAPPSSSAPIKVVYHLADGIDQAGRALANIHNHLVAEPYTKIVVVALSNGVDFMVEGAVTHSGKPFGAMVAALAAQGVEFRVCNNTLQGRNISPSKLMPEAKIVPSGIAEIARLQAREGYVYLRP
jgi:intracellular sulfur oxidation DsrE/DsrF family protein